MRSRMQQAIAGAIALSISALVGITATAPAAHAAPYVAQVAVDPLTNSVAQHQSIVEPVTATWGDTIVSTYQVGRYSTNGSGAAATGWSTSTDGGITWTSGLVPNITTATTPPGIYGRTVNMTIAYDRAHGQFILTTLGMALVGTSYQEAEMFVTRSSDGLNWTTPTSVVIGNRPDKDWTVCDNTPTSPYFGRCYIVYSSDQQSYRFQTIRSTDGGATWSAPVGTPANSGGYNVNPVVRPDGTLVVVATNQGDTSIVSFRSTDGGVSFTNTAVVTSITRHDVVGGIRDRPKPSAAVDAAGRVYAAWFDCRFRAGCANNDIVWIKSDDGLTWSSVQRVDVDPVTSTVDHFVAGLGVKPGTSGATAQLDLVFFQLPVANCTSSTCDITAVTTSSTDGGSTWSPATALHSTPMKPTWLPSSSLGRMLADYLNVVYRNGIPIATVPIAAQPVGGTTNDYRQSLHYARLSLNNADPVANIAVDCTALSCTFDASGSNDPDGAITDYTWDFGDGTTATGTSVQHDFANPGFLVTLTVTDNLGAVDTATADDQNQLPSAAFTSSCVDVVCTFDASASDDPDGTIVTYDWTFSDGATDQTATSSSQHTFAAPGSYPVALTVTDNRGGTASVTTLVTTQLPTAAPAYATDAFGRVVSNGWGTADSGGTWTVSGTAANASVDGSSGLHTITTAASTLSTALPTISSSDTELLTRVSTNKTPTGAGHWTSFILRRVNGTNEYRVRVKWATSGMALSAIKLPNSATSQFVGSEIATGLPATAGLVYRLRAQVTGTNPTTIRAKLWPDGQVEPVTWTLTQTDATPTIQAPGSVAISSFVSGTAVPVAFTFDDFTAQATNRAPIPSFTRSCVLLDCTYDATVATDPDGSISSYEWSFGDGVTATGPTPAAHPYATDGTYIATLTVTDDQGSRVAAQQSVTVSSGSGGNLDPTASFNVNCTGLACTFDGSTSSDPDGTITTYEWDFSDGASATGVNAVHTFAIPGTWPVTLTVTDDQNASASITLPAVATPPPPVIADAFSRITSNGWGSADTGGTWSISGTAANFAVNGAVATQRLTAVNTSGFARLNATPLADADIRIRIAVDQAPVGTGYWANVIGRSVTSANEYRARLRFASTGLYVGAYRVVGGTASAVIGSEVNTGLAVTPGQFYQVRMVVSGTSPTTIKIKVWLDGTTEPAAWNVVQTDSSAGLQAAGAVGISTWMQGTTPLPLTFTFDDLTVQ